MNVLTYKGYASRVEFDAEDSLFVGHIAGINDIVGFHGSSVDELKAAFYEAVDDYLETCERAMKASDKQFCGMLMVRVRTEVHVKVALEAQLPGKSLVQ